MQCKAERISLSTRGNTDILDITEQVEACIQASGLTNGLVTIFCPSSTSGVTTIEYEPGVLQDLKRAFEELAPKEYHYQHDEAWHDGNGHSHIRAALLKASFSVPLVNGQITLGTWQQIVYIDFDTRPRKRELMVQILGE